MALGGPAQSAGLAVGDKVIEVNGHNVEESYLEDVIMRVKEGGRFLSLLVVDKSSCSNMKTTGTPAIEFSGKEV